jgi:hypothetical protein
MASDQAGDLPRDTRSLCEYLVRGLVDDPDSVEVAEERREGAAVLVVRVAPEDRGKVIGRQGRVVRALRTVVRAGGIRSGGATHVEIDG